MAGPPFLTSRQVRWKVALQGFWRRAVSLYGAIATVFQLYHASDVIYEMRRRKPEPALLLIEGIFNVPHHIGMVWEELVFDDTTSCTKQSISEVIAWEIMIRSPTSKKVRHSNHAATEDDTRCYYLWLSTLADWYRVTGPMSVLVKLAL